MSAKTAKFDPALQESALYVAVYKGNEKQVRSLLNEGVDVHSKVSDPFSSIHIAVEKGHLNIIDLLLNSGADANARYPRKGDTEDGDSLLHHAVEKGNEAAVKLLLDHNADVDIKSSNGATPLHIAAERGLGNIAELLVEAGADIHVVTAPNSNTDYFLKKFRENEAIRDSLNLEAPSVQDVLITDKGYSPLHVAVINSHENIVKFLLERGADTDEEDSDGNSVLHIAVEKGDPKIVDLVLSYFPNVNAESNRGALYFAVQNRKKVYKEITEKLLQYGFSFVADDAHNPALLFEAVINNHVNIVDDFLKKGANVNERYSEEEYDEPTLLHAAVQYDYEDMVKLLVLYGADVNVESKKKQTPLFYAVKNSNVDISRFLLDKGARVDDAHILITAVEGNVLEIIEAVISRGANVHRSVVLYSELFNLPVTYEPFDDYHSLKPNSKTALFIAAEKGHNEAVELLVIKGSIVQFRTNHDLTPLLISVINGHLNVVGVLLKFGAQVESSDSYGRTALHLAAEMGHEDVVKLLLRYDAVVDCQTRSDMTPFLFACKRGSLRIADLLLKFGANLHAVDRQARTSLFIAAEYGHHKMVKFLLDRGAVLDSEDSDGFTPLLVAADESHVKCVDVLLKCGANIDHANVEGLTALHRAALKASVDTVKLLLEHGAKINCKTNTGESALHFAAEKDTPDIVEVLLKQGANPNASNVGHCSPLYLAASIGNVETVKLLLKYGAKADPAYKFNDKNSPLWASANKNHVQIVDALLKVSANNDECVAAFCTAAKKDHNEVMGALLDKVDPNDPEIRDEALVFLGYAIQGNIKVIETLLARGLNVNTVDLDGKTALHLSVENGHLDMIKLLLNNGAEVDARTNKGETPLLFAAAEGHLNIVAILLERGANVESGDNLNRTSLYCAAEYGHKKVVNFLLEAGANINPEAESKTHKTPLLIAAERDHTEIVKILLQRGARADSQDIDRLTALYFAVEFGHEKIVEELLEIGANIDCQTRNGLPLILVAAQRGHLRTLKILLKFGVDLELFGKPFLQKHFLDKIPKLKPQVFECILDFIYISKDYGYTESKDLCEYYISPLFTILNDVDVSFWREATVLNYHKVAETLVHHFEKMKAASIYPARRNLALQVYSNETQIINFRTRCVAEVGNMKSEFIRGSNVSLYHILTGSFSQLAVYAKNPLITEYFASVNLDVDFPIYSSIIKGQFQKGTMGKELQNQATEVLLCSSLFENFPPDRDPTVIIEMIVRHLNIKDLRNVVLALPRGQNVAEQ